MNIPASGIRFTLKVLPGMVFVRYPASVIPPENTIGFINGARQQCAAVFKGGEWCSIRGRPLKRQPEHWTMIETRNVG